MDNRPIGVFDSGVGGLTVVKQIMQTLPNENLVYFGDTARVPYGSKSKETVAKFSSQIINFLISKNVKAIVIACNTVSSNCYEYLSEQFKGVHIIEVVTPGVDTCLATTKNKIVGLIGTKATVDSGSYEKKLKAKDKDIVVYKKACPLFAPLAEEGWVNNEITKLTAKEYLKELIAKDIDSLILGCTHYPLLKECISSVVGKNVSIIDPAIITAKRLKAYLKESNILNTSSEKAYKHYFVSDDNKLFNDIATMVLNENCQSIKIDIDKY